MQQSEASCVCIPLRLQEAGGSQRWGPQSQSGTGDTAQPLLTRNPAAACLLGAARQGCLLLKPVNNTLTGLLIPEDRAGGKVYEIHCWPCSPPSVLLSLSRGYSQDLSPRLESSLASRSVTQVSFHQPFPPSSATLWKLRLCEGDGAVPLPNTNPSRSWKKIMAPKGIKEAGSPHQANPHSCFWDGKHKCMYLCFMYPEKLSFYF